MQTLGQVKVWGHEVQENAVEQMNALMQHGRVVDAALMADHHLGYSQPIGGVVAYDGQISPSGVGFDIACGNLAIQTNLTYSDVKDNLTGLVDEIARVVEFGVGGETNSAEALGDPVFDDGLWDDVASEVRALKPKARKQLGSTGGGNHYVDLFAEQYVVQAGKPGTPDWEEITPGSPIWIGIHFGSRGFGHSVATGYINLGRGDNWGDRMAEREEPTLIDTFSTLGAEYLMAMALAGNYAYAGRDYVGRQVLRILGAESVKQVHNHHNYAWFENDLWVVRKGATPAFPGQEGFIGGSMGDIAVIVEGVDTDEAKRALNSTVHGAGRVMSRSQAKGNRKQTRKGVITRQMMSEATKDFGVIVRGGDVDESPFVYRKLAGVLDAHRDAIKVTSVLRPIGVVMAGSHVPADD